MGQCEGTIENRRLNTRCGRSLLVSIDSRASRIPGRRVHLLDGWLAIVLRGDTGRGSVRARGPKILGSARTELLGLNGRQHRH